MRLAAFIAATACGLPLLFNDTGKADTLQLPEPMLPVGLKPYSNTQSLADAAAYVANQLASGTLQKGDEGCAPSYSCHYSEPPFPETRTNEKNGTIELITSPCESDLEVQSVHRGWALIAISYRLFAEFMEPHDGVLLAFKNYHDLLISKGDSIRAWMSNDELFRTYGETSPKLVAHINALLPASSPQLNSCLAGYWEHSLLLKDGRRIPSNAIYSQGIAMYSVGFWWRRQGERTSALTEAVLRYAINRLQR